MNRRQFLGDSSRALALAVAAKAGLRGDDLSPREQPFRFALLSDTHIPADPKNECRKFFPVENLKTALPQVIVSRPEGVILDGDAARLTGELADYQALKALLAPVAEQTPVYLGLGNHDDRENFFKIFPALPDARQKVADKHVLVLERAALRFIVLDSLLYVNKAAGLLGKPQREWLGQYLENSDPRATVLFIHHTLGDGDGDLLDVERLFRLLQPHRKVKAIFYGHSHRYAFSQEQGVHLVNLPAVGYNFSDDEPVGWVDALFTAQGVELKLNAFAGNRAGDGKTKSLSWRS